MQINTWFIHSWTKLKHHHLTHYFFVIVFLNFLIQKVLIILIFSFIIRARWALNKNNYYYTSYLEILWKSQMVRWFCPGVYIVYLLEFEYSFEGMKPSTSIFLIVNILSMLQYPLGCRLIHFVVGNNKLVTQKMNTWIINSATLGKRNLVN